MEIFDIITDIDGVLVNTPPWDPVPLAADGFYEFSSHCAKNFGIIVTAAWPARIVLSSSHKTKYTLEQWKELSTRRGIAYVDFTLVDANKTRSKEVKSWLSSNPGDNYVIIDDDKELGNLSSAAKKHWFQTAPLTGLIVTGKQIGRAHV